jgi:hypothetical protein
MARANYRIAVVFPSSLWVNTLDETAHVSDIALTGNWSLTNRHIMAVLRAVTPENSVSEIRALVIGRTSGRYRQETCGAYGLGIEYLYQMSEWAKEL